MTRQELINSVKTKVDELSPPDGDIVHLSLPDNKPIDSFVDSLLNECAKEVLMTAPIDRLAAEVCTSPVVKNGQSGYILLPENFLRLAKFKMTEWKRPVFEISPAHIAIYQNNTYLRGGKCKPVCLLGHDNTGKKVLEYYSVEADHSVECFLYIKNEAAENLLPDLQDAVAWKCAGKVLQITGKITESKMAYERGAELL